MDRGRECVHHDEGCQTQDRLEPHTTEAQSVSVLEARVVHSRSKGQEQHPLSVGSYHSSGTTFLPSFSDPSSCTSRFLISPPYLLLSEPDGLLTICFLAHRSSYFRRALPISFTTITSSRILLFNEYRQCPFPRTTQCRSPVDPLWPVTICVERHLTLRREYPSVARKETPSDNSRSRGGCMKNAARLVSCTSS